MFGLTSSEFSIAACLLCLHLCFYTIELHFMKWRYYVLYIIFSPILVPNKVTENLIVFPALCSSSDSGKSIS